MAKPGGMSKLGPANPYGARVFCECMDPLVTMEDDGPRCVRCGHDIDPRLALEQEA